MFLGLRNGIYIYTFEEKGNTVITFVINNIIPSVTGVNSKETSEFRALHQLFFQKNTGQLIQTLQKHLLRIPFFKLADTLAFIS